MTGPAIRYGAIAVVFAVLANLFWACANPPQTPETARERLAVAEASFTATVRSLTVLVQTGQIDPQGSVAASLDAGIQSGDLALDAAQAALAAGDEVTALEWLTAFNAILLQLQTTQKANGG